MAAPSSSPRPATKRKVRIWRWRRYRAARPRGSPPRRKAAPGDTQPSISPDGKLLAFARATGGGEADEARDADIFICKPDGSALRRITFDAKPIHGISWTADSQEIIYGSRRASKSGIWRVGLAGANPKEVQVQGRQPRYPTVARKSGRMAYSEMPQTDSIWLAPVDGGMAKARPVIRSSGHDTLPTFSPDGAALAMLSDQSGADEIWVSNLDGSGRRQLTQFNGSGHPYRPRWAAGRKDHHV